MLLTLNDETAPEFIIDNIYTFYTSSSILLAILKFAQIPHREE